MIETLFTILVILFSVALHEAAHGFAAYYMGDPTAKYEGRLTLNPIKHLDIMGSLIVPGLFLLVTGGRGPVFGWAKPVPVNPQNFHDKRKGEMLVSFAGPGANLALAFVSGMAARTVVGATAFNVSASITLTNLGLAFFNLLPFPPLDGSHIVLNLFPEKRWKIESFFRKYGLILFALFLMFGMDIVSPLIFAAFRFLVGV